MSPAQTAQGLVYLSLASVEVANGERFRAYLELAANKALLPNLEVVSQTACSAIVNVENGGASYVSQSADPAPWYSASVPESADYLGFNIDTATWTRDIDVPQTDRVTLGSALGRPRRKASVLHIEGMVVARSCAGLAYGLRYLERAVGATCDTNCGGADARFRQYCPPSGYADSWGVYQGFHVVASSTPKITAVPGNGCCDWARIEFDLLFPDVDVWASPVAVTGPSALYGSLGGNCIDICTWLQGQPDPIRGTVCATAVAGAAGVVKIVTGAYPVNGFSVWQDVGVYPSSSLYPSDCLYPGASGVPQSPPQACYAPFQFGTIPAGTTLLIDAARRVIVTVAADGTESDATSLLLGGSTTPSWPIADCGQCISVAAGVEAYCAGGDDATVTITSRLRS